MSKTILKRAYYYMTDEQYDRLEKIRGEIIPRSRLGTLAVQRLLDEIESGKVNLLTARYNDGYQSESETLAIGDRK